MKAFDRTGFIYPLLLVSLVVLALFSNSISRLNQGYRKQVVHLTEKNLSFEIAYSALSGMLARVYVNPWKNRFFSTPTSQMGISLLDGRYDFFICDSPGHEKQFDAYIQVHFKEKERLYFWRIQYFDDLLETSNHFRIIYFETMNAVDIPTTPNNPIVDRVESLLQRRRQNQPKAMELSQKVLPFSDSAAIAAQLGAPAPEYDDSPNLAFNPKTTRSGTSPDLPVLPPVSPSEVPKPASPGSGSPGGSGSGNPVPATVSEDDLKSALSTLDQNRLRLERQLADAQAGARQLDSSFSGIWGAFGGPVDFDAIGRMQNLAATWLKDFAATAPSPEILAQSVQVADSYLQQALTMAQDLLTQADQVPAAWSAYFQAHPEPIEVQDEDPFGGLTGTTSTFDGVQRSAELQTWWESHRAQQQTRLETMMTNWETLKAGIVGAGE
jgi:hypothetical protein